MAKFSDKNCNTHLVSHDSCPRTGLPDGIFSHQKSQFGSIMEGFGLENVCILYDHMEYFTAMLWPFGLFYGHLLYFSSFGMFYQEKSGNPVPKRHH
jgi:hypothetical protein